MPLKLKVTVPLPVLAQSYVIWLLFALEVLKCAAIKCKPEQLLLTLKKDFIDSWKHVGDLKNTFPSVILDVIKDHSAAPDQWEGGYRECLHSTQDGAWFVIHTNPHHDLRGIYSNVGRLLRALANVFFKSPKVDNNIARFKISF